MVNDKVAKVFFTGLMIVMFASCNHNKKEANVSSADIQRTVNHISGWTVKADTDSLIIYTPHFKNIDLVCGTMPSENDSNVIFCAEAAYTGEILDVFKHSNILGDHVSKGKRYRGTPCKRNTGAFVYYNHTYKFVYKQCSAELDRAAKYGGMGFCQEMLIHQGRIVLCKRNDNNENAFRALCALNRHLCVIDSKDVMRFGDFKQALLHLGVTEALYLDMGAGWNYSWWRDDKGKVNIIYPKVHCYTTNWITFYN